MATRKRIVTKIGDVFCAVIEGRYKMYFQYIGNDQSQLNSSMIRVFKTKYDLQDDPSLEEVVKDEVMFYAHTALRVGIGNGSWEKVGKVPPSTNRYGYFSRPTTNTWILRHSTGGSGTATSRLWK